MNDLKEYIVTVENHYAFKKSVYAYNKEEAISIILNGDREFWEFISKFSDVEVIECNKDYAT